MRGFVVVVVLLAVSMAPSACTVAENSPETEPAGGSIWEGATVEGAEVFTEHSPKEMAAEADFVARGHFTGACNSRTVGKGDLGDSVTYSCLTFTVEEFLAGEGPKSVPVEFLAELSEGSVPEPEAVVFLLDKGGAEAGRYRTVNSYGLFTRTTRADVDQPLRAEVADRPQLAADGLETDSWADFVASLRSTLER